MEALIQPTVSSVSVLDLHDSLHELGYLNREDCPEIWRSRNEFGEAESRCSADAVYQLWQLAIERGAEPHIGVVVGQKMNPEYKGLLSNLVISSTNLLEALRLFERYISVMSEVDVITLTPVESGLKLSYSFTDERFWNHLSVGRSMSAAITWARYLTGKPVTPLEAGFRASRVTRPDVYSQVFGAYCRFGMPQDYLVVSEPDLQQPVLFSNEYIKRIIRDRVEVVNQNLNGFAPTSRLVRNVIEDDLHLGVVTTEYVASKLNTSRQTMQRKLRREGNSFSGLISDIRKEKARLCLEQNCCKIEQLSESLGFSEPSAFFKAFKGWFNTTPRRFSAK